jgi:hypothetical protein
MAGNPNNSMMEDLIESGELEGSVQNSSVSESAEQALSGNSQELQQQQEAKSPVDFEALLAEKTNGKFKSVDEILQLTDKAVTQDINFANETTKKVYEYLKDGKVDEFVSLYQEQKKLSSLTNLDTDDVLKMRIKYENPELTDDEVEEEFSYKYSISEPDIDEDLDSPEEIAKEKKRFERERINMERLKKKDLKEAKDFLNSKKEEIVLPDISTNSTQRQQQEVAEVDEAEVKEFRDKYLNTIPAAVDEIVGFENKYKDSELEFNTTYILDQTDKSSLKEKLENFTLQDYFVPRYISENGSFDTEAIAQDLYVLENLDKIIEAHVSQAVNQTRASFVKGLKNANYQESVSRQMPDEQKVRNDEMVNFFFGNT